MNNEIKKIKLLLKGLSCANCANKIENKINDIEEVKEANINFATSTLNIKIQDNDKKEEIIEQIRKIVKSIEKDVIVEELKESVKRPIQIKSKCKDGCCNISSFLSLS